MSLTNPDAVFLAEIQAFLRNTGMSATAFGTDAIQDPSFVFDLTEGDKPRSPSGRTVQRVREFMAASPEQRAKWKADRESRKHDKPTGRATTAA